MKIAVLAGDGIGPEVMQEAVKVLRKVAEIFGHSFEFVEALVGGAAWDQHGEHFPVETREICEKSDAILFGSVGGPVWSTEKKWLNCETNSILAMRKFFEFNVNLRPARTYGDLPCILKNFEEVDILCVRELSSGIYFGEHKLEDRRAYDVMQYTEEEIESVARVAFKAARGRRKKISSVDKANVLACSRLWRRVVEKVACDFPDVIYEHILVDNMAMQILKRPASFDTVLMPNMFGDIISDEVSVFAGSLGMLPSASINGDGFAMYEPAGGSAPDIAGSGIANPIGMILSAAMMLKYSFDMQKEHDAIQQAVHLALCDGARTADLGGTTQTVEMGDLILNHLKT